MIYLYKNYSLFEIIHDLKVQIWTIMSILTIIWAALTPTMAVTLATWISIGKLLTISIVEYASLTVELMATCMLVQIISKWTFSVKYTDKFELIRIILEETRAHAITRMANMALQQIAYALAVIRMKNVVALAQIESIKLWVKILLNDIFIGMFTNF